MKHLLFSLSFLILTIFTIYSYNVAKERFQQSDFDITVKIQDRMPKRFDDNFSILSLIGSLEVTFVFCLIGALLSILRFNWRSILAWLMIIPASLAEVFGKLVIYHPAPPLFFHRTSLATHLPSFYVHTEFSYPSGHMTRTIFIITLLVCIFFFSKLNFFLKYSLIFSLLILGFMMGLTRVSLGEHWLSDVLGGGLLGLGVGLFAYMLMFKKVHKSS